LTLDCEADNEKHMMCANAHRENPTLVEKGVVVYSDQSPTPLLMPCEMRTANHEHFRIKIPKKTMDKPRRKMKPKILHRV
jgi:hypothetical protein